MATLTPKLSSQIAEIPYRLLATENGLQTPDSVNKYFSFDRKERSFEGKTGGILGLISIGKRSEGFAVVGIGKGKFKDEIVIAIRGTRRINDWVTNANIGLKGSPNGAMGHAGFINTFHTLRPQIKKYLLSQHKLPKRIHCVGHSLGGALASLFADWLRDELSVRVNLYTFGAPRIGHSSYARKSDQGNDKIFRCTHGADPVPMVPLWPFRHAPYSGMEYRLDGSSGINKHSHGMGASDNPGYVNTANSESWDTLKVRSNHFLNTPVRLRFENRNQAQFNEHWADKLSAALMTLLKDAGYITAVSTQFALSSGLTFYDQLSRYMEKIAQASKKLSEQTKGLLGHMLVFAGKVVQSITDLSARFIKWVFEVTIGKLYRAAKSAIESL